MYALSSPRSLRIQPCNTIITSSSYLRVIDGPLNHKSISSSNIGSQNTMTQACFHCLLFYLPEIYCCQSPMLNGRGLLFSFSTEYCLLLSFCSACVSFPFFFLASSEVSADVGINQIRGLSSDFRQRAIPHAISSSRRKSPNSRNSQFGGTNCDGALTRPLFLHAGASQNLSNHAWYF